MKSLKYVAYIFIAVMTIVSCSKDDDRTYDENVDTSFMYQPHCSDVSTFLNTTGHLRVLAIGNSYLDDYTSLLKALMDKSLCVMDSLAMYELVRNDGSFKTWYDCSKGEDTVSYSAIKIFDGVYPNLPVGECGANDTTLLSTYMQQEWDVILFQQNDKYATYYSSWCSKSDAGYLLQWASYINEHQPNTIFGIIMDHSSASNYESNSENSHIWRWQNIANAIKRLQKDYPLFQIVVPCGTAIENLRGSELNDEYDLTCDGTHLGYGLARFVASGCLYQKLFYPFTDKHLEDNEFRGGVSEWEKSDSTAYPYVEVTNENIRIARNSAIDASDYPFNVGQER